MIGQRGGTADPTMQCRVDGGGEDGGMRTVECLRGRLLAERVASKAAKEEADQLAKRLNELEKKLADEIKVRNMAERRLRRAVKKLESLKILDVELSDSSIGSLSSNGCSGARPAPEVEERNSPGSLSSADSASRGEAKGWGGDGDGDGDSARGSSSAGSCTQVNSSSQDGSWCSVLSEQSQSGPSKEENRMDVAPVDTKSCRSVEGAGDYDPERGELVASNGSTKSEPEEELYRDAEDDRLALVPVEPHYDAEADDSRTGDGAGTPAAKLQLAGADANEEEEEEKSKLAIVPVDVPQPPRHDVQSVLLALRQVKQQLRYTIQRRSSPELAVAAHHQELCGH